MKAAILDRDGTILVKRGEYLTTPEQVELLPGAAGAIRRLRDAGWRVVVATNQSAVARGMITEAVLGEIHDRMRAQLDAAGARLDAVYYCPHYRNGCDCRKPLPGLLRRAAQDFNLALDRCVMVGDQRRDLEAGRAAGTRTVLVLTGDGAAETLPSGLADHVAPDLGAAVDWMLSSRPR